MSLALQSAEPVTAITDRARVGHLLMRVMDSRAPLAVSVPGVFDVYTSLIIEIDLQKSHLLLDELHPSDAMTRIQPGTLMRMRTRADGSPLDFLCRIEGVQSAERGALYQVSWPTDVQYHERRNSFRVMIPADMSLPPATFTSALGSFRGRLTDVSSMGVGTVVAEAPNADIGASVTCTLSLPNTRLITDAQVRSAINSMGTQRLGILFCNLSSAQKSAIARAVTALDRSLLKRYASARWV